MLSHIIKAHNILQNRTAVSLLSIFTTCVVIFMMTGALYIRNEVTITDGDNTYKVYTAQSNPEHILAEQGIALTEMDSYSFGGFDDNSVNRANLSITRMNLSSLEAEEVSTAFSPAPAIDEPVSTFTERTEVKIIPYTTFHTETNLLAMGTSEVAVAGVDGEELITILDEVVDGEVISSVILSSEIVSLPTEEEILVGLALQEPYSKRDFPEIELIDGLPVNYEFMLSGKSTAYTAEPTSVTASGRALEVGIVAVDPRLIPYGSLLYIVTQDGSIVYGAGVAADTGGFIYVGGYVSDVYMGLTEDGYDDAINWGVRNVDVYVINTGLY